MKNKHPTNNGFSLMEILVVIAIIGILTTIILANASIGRTKSQAAQILSDFQTIESALTFMALNHNVARWWSDDDNPTCKNNPNGDPNIAPVIPGNETVCASNPDIQSLIDNSPADGLAKYLSQAPVPPPVGNPSGPYKYDRDSADVFDLNENGCADVPGDHATEPVGSVARFGAILELKGMNAVPEIFNAIDKAVDGGNESDPQLCGKIRYVETGGAQGPCSGTGVGSDCNIVYMLSRDGKL
jgi:prepilin-type N-terminal cleavage/methylation domain-containing protein